MTTYNNNWQSQINRMPNLVQARRVKNFLEQKNKYTNRNFGCRTMGHISPVTTGSAIMTPGPVSNCSYGGIPNGGTYDNSIW